MHSVTLRTGLSGWKILYLLIMCMLLTTCNSRQIMINTSMPGDAFQFTFKCSKAQHFKHKRLYWEGVPGGRAGGWGNPGGPLWHVARSLGIQGDGISLRVVSGQSVWLMGLPGGSRIAQPRWMPSQDSGRWEDMWCPPFDLSRTPPVGGGLLAGRSLPGPSCRKITHVNG